MYEIFITFDQMLGDTAPKITWTSEALLFGDENNKPLRPQFYEIGEAILAMQKSLCNFYGVNELGITEIRIVPLTPETTVA
jgi:hypothetical protein